MADALLQIGIGPNAVRMKDMQDGTIAEVFAAGTSSASAVGDVLVDIGDGINKVRLRDMGDGTVATVVYGK